MQTHELLSTTSELLSRLHLLRETDIPTLREIIRAHNRLYYNDESPIISDTEYDELFHALARLEADHGVFDETSPTAKLAILASEQFQKVAHIYPMISLDNTYSTEEVNEWNERMLRILSKSEQNPPNPPSTSSGQALSQRGIETSKPANRHNLSYYIQPKYD